MLIRPADLPNDCAGLLALDTSFITDRVYQVQATATSFNLVESAIAPPLRKTFSLADELGDQRLWQSRALKKSERSWIASPAVLERWNRRALASLHGAGIVAASARSCWRR